MQKDLITIPISKGKRLVAEVYDNNPEYCNAELCIGIKDEEGNWIQDIVCIRESKKLPNKIETLVYADSSSEDYTDKFNIDVYEEGVKDENI